MLLRLGQTQLSPYVHRLCALCALPLAPHDDAWCQHCLRYFAPQPRCQRCGLPMPDAVELCGECLRHPPPWQRLFCIGDYAFPLSHYIHQVKHQGQFWMVPPLSELLAPRIEHPAPLITFVPLHWRRQCRRGFNQSEQLARALARHWSGDVQPLFRRSRHTRPQQSLTRSERQSNLKQAFQLTTSPRQTRLAIVDDVVTTGATMEELCELLLEVGVKYIDIYCLSRTPDTL